MSRRLNPTGLLCITALAVMLQCCNSVATDKEVDEPVPDKISYNFDIRPILSDKCFICHGPDASKRQAGLRLDLAESAYKALEENPAAHVIVPGQPTQSEVFLRITSQDTSYKMPPVESNLSLTAHEIKLIEKWIRQGAKYESHWAFTAPEDPGIPDGSQKLTLEVGFSG